MILAIDPGTTKVGWAVMDVSGGIVDQGIVILDSGDGRLNLAIPEEVRTIVLGNGTNRVNIEAELLRLCPQATIVVVDETASTVEAWELKREEEAGRNAFRQIWFTLVQLFNPVAVDDYAARVLALRYLWAVFAVRWIRHRQSWVSAAG